MSQGTVLSQPLHNEKDHEMKTQTPPEAVVVQPGAGFAPQPQPAAPGVMAPPTNVMVPAGLPASLSYFAALDEIKVHQILDLVEVLVGWEKNNRYDICNKNDQKFLFAKEDTDCCTRQMCGVMRPFVMNITDNYNQPLMTLNRPFRCQSSIFWCCYLQEMEIQSPPGVLQGTIKEVWTACVPKYRVHNAQGQVLFTIVGECCYCKCCVDVLFRVFQGGGEIEEIGTITKHWGGCREMFGGANDFTIKFPVQMDLFHKMLLFGATFLIDFNYFEYRGNNS